VINVLVTGSNGFIGSQLAVYLESKEYHVWKLDRHFQNEMQNQLRIDISRKIEFEAISNMRFDAIVHCAAQTDVRKSVEDPTFDLMSNGLGTLNLIEFVAQTGISNFIYINSGGAIYGNEELPLSEKSFIAPSSPYGLSKFVGEEYVRILGAKFGFTWSSLALSNVYGDVVKNKKGVIYEFSKSLKMNKTPVIYGKEITRDFIYIDDVISAIEKSLVASTQCRVNISSNIETSIYEIYDLVAGQLNSEIKPEIKAPRFGEIMRSKLDNSLAREKLDWKPLVSVVDGVKISLVNVDQLGED
jgi:UDP-glucose 4-epimerase